MLLRLAAIVGGTELNSRTECDPKAVPVVERLAVVFLEIPEPPSHHVAVGGSTSRVSHFETRSVLFCHRLPLKVGRIGQKAHREAPTVHRDPPTVHREARSRRIFPPTARREPPTVHRMAQSATVCASRWRVDGSRGRAGSLRWRGAGGPMACRCRLRAGWSRPSR